MQKSFILLIFSMLSMIAYSQKPKPGPIFRTQPSGKDFTIISMGATEAYNTKYHIKATIVYEAKEGYVVNFSSDVPVAKVILERWTGTAGAHDDQLTSFPTPVQNYSFNLSSPAYTGGKQYNLLLYLHSEDKKPGYIWRIHLLRK